MSLKKRILASIAVLAACAFAAGCGSSPQIEYSRSPDQPIVSCQRTQALPPEFSPKGPVFIVYGDGTAYRRGGSMDYVTGRLTGAQLERLLTSIVDAGFFRMKQVLGNPQPGGAVDHVTVTLKGASYSVEAPEGTTGDFGSIVNGLRSFRIPGEKEYLPDTITLYASENPPGQAVEDKVLEWTADPGLPAQASANRNAEGAGLLVRGPQAQQVWKLLRDAPSSGGPVAWSAGGKVYTSVYADPFFPAPGV